MLVVRALGKAAKAAAVVAGAVLAFVLATNIWVCSAGGGMLVSRENAQAADADCILVLGASVLPDGTPSSILRDRLDVAADLYKEGVAPKVLVSGDNGDDSYNEVAAMKAYLVECGIPSEDVFCDHCGFNTYDSMWRARNVFGAEKIVVVTQTYHEYRALFNAQGVGMQACGVASDLHQYENQSYYDLREVLARTKDFCQVVEGATATVGGSGISLQQSGDVT